MVFIVYVIDNWAKSSSYLSSPSDDFSSNMGGEGMIVYLRIHNAGYDWLL